jgi:hypothetical protein
VCGGCRSAEGRKRIIAELVRTLSGKEGSSGRPGSAKAAPVQPSPAAQASIPFREKPGYPPPYKACALPFVAPSR